MRRFTHCSYVLLATALVLAAAPVAGADATQQLAKSVAMLRLVDQGHNPMTPWKQKSMNQGTGTGFVIEGNRVLTNAHNVTDSKYVEMRTQGSAKRFPARVAFIGHDCDLAVLVPMDESFFEGMPPLPIGGLPAVNSTVSTYGFPLGGRHVSVTEGVVSRVQTDVYSLTAADQHLVVQTDAAINPGNSGGPVVQDGTVVGVAFQGLTQADNIGYMIPTTVIRHFLKDIEDGKYDGYGSLGFSHYSGLHNQSYKEYLKIPADQQGLVVTRVLMNSSVDKVLEPGDVVTHIGGYDIDNDGMIEIDGLRLDMSESIERKQMNEPIDLVFYRSGERRSATVTVAMNRPVLEYGRQFDKPPRYVVYAGLTFIAMSRDVLETWGENWLSSMPPHLRYVFMHAMDVNRDPKRKEFIILSKILPDAVNTYAESFESHILERVNDVPIYRLEDIPGALEKAKDGFFIFRFWENQRPFILDAAKASERHGAILKQYNVPADRRLEEKA